VTAYAAWIAIGAPLVGVIVAPLLARINSLSRDVGAVLCSFAAALAAVSLLPKLLTPESLPIEHAVVWLEQPLAIGFGVLVDPLSIVLANVVAVISFVIMVYCVGYMKGDPAQTRFWMLMNGFIGSMLLLVLSNNLLFLFIGWKLVGVCSYGLIGFYYQDQKKYWIGGPPPTAYVTPSQACLKALVMTGAGDMLMLGGILLLYVYAGTLNILELYESVSTWLPSMAAVPGMMVLVTLLLLAGPLGKSAQFPFHEWLPEAMAGPGPVSALIHAATMVKSGVYLVARLVPIFYYGYWTADIPAAGWFFVLTAWVGGFTAFLAATQGLVALELKKVLAYSTVSQIGYMLMGLGAAGLAPGLVVEGYTAGIFHLFSHALFKSCLFLCAGTVIHAVHSFYLTDMGGTRKALPYTWGCMLVAALALMGLPPFPGFWSKDAVLLVAANASLPLFGLGLLTATLTAFYTVRFFGLVFHGEASAHVAHATGAGLLLDDGASSMRWAAGVLAVAIVLAGIGGPAIEGVLHHAFEVRALPESMLVPAEPEPGLASEGESGSWTHTFVPILSVLFVLAGALPAWYFYMARKASPAVWVATRPVATWLHTFLWNRWLIDQTYTRVFVRTPQRLASWVAREVETPFDTLVHRRLPVGFTGRVQRLVDRVRADTEELLYNVSYVLVLFVMLLAYLFWGTPR